MPTGDLAVPSGGMGFGPGHLPHRAIFLPARADGMVTPMAPAKKISVKLPASRDLALSLPGSIPA
jgi:hypothetical protein